MAVVTCPAPERLRARQGSKWWRFPSDVLPFMPAESDFAPCPAVQDALADLVSRQAWGYPRKGPEGAVGRLKNAFIGHARGAWDWSPDPDDLLVLPSSSQAITGAIRAYSEPDEGVLLQTPAYPGFFDMIDAAGRRPCLDPLVATLAGPSLAPHPKPDLRQPRNAIWLLCQPHNPTGRVFSRDELAPLAEKAAEDGMIVVSDELHADLRLDGHSHTPFAAAFPELASRTVTLHAPTKVFGIAGLGGVVAHFGDKTLIERFLRVNPPDLLGSPNIAALVAGTAAWEQGGAWRDEMIAIVRRNRDRFVDRVTSELPKVKVRRPEATFFLWADLADLHLPASPAEYLLDHARVGASDGAKFGPGSDSFVRFVGACAPGTMEQMLDRVIGLLAQRR